MNQTVLILGGTGFIGSALGLYLVKQGLKIRILTRKALDESAKKFPCEFFQWDGQRIPTEAIDHCYAVINLIGEPIMDHPWTKQQKQKIMTSRIHSIEAIINSLKLCQHPPQIFIQASAIGYYQSNNAPTTPCTEDTGKGQGFIAEVCSQWEEKANQLRAFGRLTIVRIGMVMQTTAGAFAKMWALYVSGLGVNLGNGNQWFNWIHIKDLTAIFHFILTRDHISGVLNGVAPEPMRYGELHQALAAKTISLRKAHLSKPLLKLVLGQRAALLLDSFQVVPQKLIDCQFTFQFGSKQQVLHEVIPFKPQLVFENSQWLATDLDHLWEFMKNPLNLEKLSHPDLGLKLLSQSSKTIERGALIHYQFQLGAINIPWKAVIVDLQPSKQFTDQQLKGPYQSWVHTHRFEPVANGVIVHDLIRYTLPLAPVGNTVLPLVQNKLAQIFAYRNKALYDWLIQKKQE